MPEAAPRVRPPALDALDRLAVRGMKLGLGAIGDTMARLGHPERALPHILVGGTNGKGSTAAALSSIFRAAGIRAGLHTSPHLIDVTERVRVADDDVSIGALGAALDDVFGAATETPAITLTYFEALTAAAERIFERAGCQLSLIHI